MTFRVKARDYFHYAVAVKREDIIGRGAGAVRALREQYIPRFMKMAGITDVKERGLRLVIDLNAEGASRMHLFAGEGAPNVNPQDWRVPKDHPSLITHQTLGVTDHKTEIHFLSLSSPEINSFMDPCFTPNMWEDMFIAAQATLKALIKRYDLVPVTVRMISNAGLGFQFLPRAHFYVQAYFDGRLVSELDPVLYGFAVRNNGVIEVNANGTSKLLKSDPAQEQAEIIRMIDERGSITGSGPEQKEARIAIDRLLLWRLAEIRR